MSYAEKLFDNLPLANQHVLQCKKAVEELLLFFKSIVAVDENYAKSIENLSNFQFLLLKGSLHEAALALKHDIQNKATQLRAFIDNMTQDIIKPLQSILNTLVEQAKSLSSEAQKTVKMKEKYFDKLNRYKEKF